MEKKEVVWPIKVPVGKYCWEYLVTGSCDFFDNEGGYETCELKFWGQKSAKKGVIKDPMCAALKDAQKIEQPKGNSEDYDELKNIASHIADCSDLESILVSHTEDILAKLENCTDEELLVQKKFFNYLE